MTGRDRLIFTLTCVAAIGGSGCSNPYQPEPPEPPTTVIHVQGVTVTPQVIQFLAIGETKQLAVRVAPLNATDQAISWESSDPAVATVDSTGLVTAKGVGVGVFVTAYTRDGRHEASANVSVLP
jgi:uncharacterized protein YjdB